MDKRLIDHINAFALAANKKPITACATLGLTQAGHDRVLYCWLTSELETPACLYEFISLCTENPKRNDLATTEWWKTNQKHFSEGMGYLYGVDTTINQPFASDLPRNLTPALFGSETHKSTIEPRSFGGTGDKIWRWIEENSGGTGWIPQSKITKRFQNVAKSEEIHKLLDQWLKDGKLEHEKHVPETGGRTANIYRALHKNP